MEWLRTAHGKGSSGSGSGSAGGWVQLQRNF